jgi:hypothetical protein
MLIVKAAQVLTASAPVIGKSWEMDDERNPGKKRAGVSNYCDLTVLGADSKVYVVRLRGKDAAEVTSKLARYTLGKPAEIPVVSAENRQRRRDVLQGLTRHESHRRNTPQVRRRP